MSEEKSIESTMKMLVERITYPACCSSPRLTIVLDEEFNGPKLNVLCGNCGMSFTLEAKSNIQPQSITVQWMEFPLSREQTG